MMMTRMKVACLYLCLCLSIALCTLASVEGSSRFADEFDLSKVQLTESRVDSYLCDDVVQYAGYVKISTNGEKNLFFWFFESRRDPVNDPMTIWLTGGPGCSSLMALLTENGPCTVDPSGYSTTRNPYSWNSQSNVMWIDQPVGTGYSYGSPLDTDQAQVATDLYAFLQAWFTVHKEYSNNSFYVTGESYGGHYVPSISNYIYQQNQQNPLVYINLKGMAIGNGLTDPAIQYAYYANYAQNNSVHQLVSDSVLEHMIEDTKPCLKLIEKCNNETSKSVCEDAQNFCDKSLFNPVSNTGVNLYDVRIQCADPPLCYNFTDVTTFVTLPSTKAALNVVGHEWHGICNYNVNGRFSADWMHDYNNDVPALLASNITVLIYAGDDDFICNYMGNKAWTLGLEWPGKEAFNAAEDHPWIVNGTQAGIARSAEGLNFLQVFNAGHMVPMNQPENALAMINQFFDGIPF